MRIAAILAIPIIVISSCGETNRSVVPSGNSVKEDSLAILQNFEKQELCWNSQDLICYMEAYDSSETIQTISRAGIEKGYSAILASYQRYFPPEHMGKLHFDQMDLKRLSDSFYYVVGRFNLRYAVPDTVFQGWFSVLMEKKNDKWCIISDHSS